MEVSDWKFAKQFNDLYQRALKLSKDCKEYLQKNNTPLMEWTGDTEFPNWLCSSSNDSPPEVINIRRVQPEEEFVCWLMLPKDHYGEHWYFGRVFSQRRNSMPNEILAFKTIASECGKLLRSDSRFCEYLSPCLDHTKFVRRFPSFEDELDASYWCALMFTRPDHAGRLQFPFVGSVVGRDIATARSNNPFKETADVIANWGLALPNPKFARGHVARPYKWPVETSGVLPRGEKTTNASSNKITGPLSGPSASKTPKRHPGINARMIEVIQKNDEALGWNSRQWAEHLKCVKSSVVATLTWKDLAMRRDRERAERARDRRRKPKASDQKRD